MAASSEERLVETANSEPIGIYPDAEEEIERRRRQLDERVRSAAPGSNSPAGLSGGSATDESTSGGQKGRGAGQG